MEKLNPSSQVVKETEQKREKDRQYTELFRHVRCGCPSCGANLRMEAIVYLGGFASDYQADELVNDLVIQATHIREVAMNKPLETSRKK